MLTRIIAVTGMVLAVLLGGCNEADQSQGASHSQQYEWKLVTTWPKNFPGLGRAPETFAQYVEAMSGGRLKVKVYGAGELVPWNQVFDAVSAGTAEMGHGAAYYWKGKSPAAQLFATIPFGMNATEMNSWLHYGGGMELWRETYQPYGVVPFAGGNTGVQMAGWFKKPIERLEDLKGLKIRMPGLGAEVLDKIGAVPVAMSGGELFTALQTGAIDATEWVGPYNDRAFGLYKAADYYYYSGWHEPGTSLEFIVNQQALESLPEDLRAIVEVATKAVNQDMLDEYTARNNEAMQSLISEHGVDVRPLPADVMQTLKRVSAQVMEEQAAADPQFKRVYQSYKNFQQRAAAYHQMSEVEYYKNRDQ